MPASVTTTPLPGVTPGADPSWAPAAAVRRGNLALERATAALAGRTGRVLEVGAGTARFLRALRARLPQMEAHASDLSHQSLLFAHRQDPALTVVRGDFTALPYRNSSFDIVLVFDVLEHLPDPDRGLAEVRRVLTPGGVLHALVPCEGQPLTLHWLMWKLGVAADLKEKRVGHVQRFTHHSIVGMLQQHGFQVLDRSYSMHPLGQAKDVLTYLEEGPQFPHWLRRNSLFRLLSLLLWGGSFAESTLLRGVPLSAVALHVTAVKQ